MTEINELSKSFDQTLKDSNLHGVSASLAEIASDSLMDDGVAKEIPIIGTIVGLGKVAIGIKDSIFLKKIIYFITEINNISAESRYEIIEEIDNSNKFRMKIGEKLIYIIDKCADHEQSQIVACLFSAFLSKRISYDEFLRASHIVGQLIPEDLEWFVKEVCGGSEQWEHRWDGSVTVEEAGNIASTGLVQLVSPEITVRDQDDRKMYEAYIVEGSELMVYVSDIGRKIGEILKDHFG